MADSDVFPDCGGLCWPGPPGSTVDTAMMLGALDDARRLAASAQATQPRLADAIATGLRQRPSGAARNLRNIFGSHDAAAGARATRQLIHAPGLHLAALDLAAEAFAAGPILLPHLRAQLHAGGAAPVIVAGGPATVFTWLDGESLTIPRGWTRLPPDFIHPRLTALPEAAGAMIVNADAEILADYNDFDPAPVAELAEAGVIVRDGAALLGRVWPEAADAAGRHLRGLLILRRRGYSRSHSPVGHPGLVMLTATDPFEVVDLLVHELSHVRMNAIRRFDGIDLPTGDPRRENASFASPWRDDPRPLRGLTDGVHAFLNVCELYRRLAAALPTRADWARGIFARQAGHVRTAWATLSGAARPTRLGAMLYDDLAAGVARL